MKVHLPVREAILNRRTYEAPAEGRSEKLRLDFNENTAGCSPAVRRALAKLTTKQLAMYPSIRRRRGGSRITSVSARKNCCSPTVVTTPCAFSSIPSSSPAAAS